MSHPFVEFLVVKGEISGETADRTLQWARRNLEPIGMIAVQHGLIVGRQIDEVLDRQRISNAKFGQIAIELGFMSEEKVEVLLQIQHCRLMKNITEALALAGFLPLDAGMQLLAEFVTRHPDPTPETCQATTA